MIFANKIVIFVRIEELNSITIFTKMNLLETLHDVKVPIPDDVFASINETKKRATINKMCMIVELAEKFHAELSTSNPFNSQKALPFELIEGDFVIATHLEFKNPDFTGKFLTVLKQSS